MEGTGPFLLAQWTTAEPSMVLAVPHDAWKEWGQFVMPPGYTGGLTISADLAPSLSIDGVPVPGPFETIGLYSAVTVDVLPGPHVVSKSGPCELWRPFSLVVAGDAGTAHFAFGATTAFQL